ncbi:MAG: energy-coupling factor transporter transmembrane protein EcfT, partial [Clostridiales Family XIII bacterium]|jgi:energy-coupling factor transport system permease protein|nr:energy-coupling factor transporter transmembrane protein EcfT [Clostridiales Family XIII bacterium]
MAVFRNTWRIFAALIGWVMEDSLDTARAMRARGYGSGRRTHYAARALRKTDVLALILLGFLFCVSLFIIVHVLAGETLMVFAENQGASFEVWAEYGLLFVCYVAMLLYPVFIEGKDRVKLWALSR